MALQSCDAGQAEILSLKPTFETYPYRRDSMTDAFYAATSITGHHHAAPATLPNVVAFNQNQRYAVSPLDGAQEDDGQISCFCGFGDDDGDTVGCDGCDRWNHIICYYPQYNGQGLPEDLQHFCIECKPRPVDAHAASVRQRIKRDQHELYANGMKRQAAKSHKKKVKEPAGYTNGWPVDKVRHDRNSASPRDLPPPAKRPKTSHRPSEPIVNGLNKGQVRKRTATNTNLRRSVSRSPDAPIEVYSSEFMRCYHDDLWNVTHVNLHNDINVTNSLSEWLRSPEDVCRDKYGFDKPQVLMRWDGELEDIPGKAQIEIRNEHDNNFRDADGNCPTWKTVTVQEPVARGAYIGELKGHVGFKEEYKDDPANRWLLMRHPEPFVFFHPRLPIYVDARNEGTELRYVRRSCTPNAELRVLVTDSTDYRFCLMATEQIDPGMEVAVGWDTAESLPDKVNSQNGTPSTKDMDVLSTWVSTVLSNCGPCACQRPPSDCAMSRFDRRGAASGYEDEAQSMKMPKGKRKKAGLHISPLDTHAHNSRSGSEARRVEPDDEPTDSRSTSGSGRGSASRDITPNTHYSANGSLSAMPELSARERKKLEKEEEMFRRQEEEQSGKSKKKRNSAGSALNTPSVTSSKQLGFPGTSSRYADAGTSRQSGLSSAKPPNCKRPRAPTAHKTPAKTVTKTVARPKPNYSDVETQCDMDEEDAKQRAAMPPPPRRKYLSVTQLLLKRCAVNNARHEALCASSKVASSPDNTVDMDSPSVEAEEPASPRSIASRADVAEPEPRLAPEPEDDRDDASMEDAPGEDDYTPPAELPAVRGPETNELTSGNDSVLSHPPMEPPAPPWSSKISPSIPDAPSPTLSHKSINMHLEMPPPQPNPFAGPNALFSAGTLNSITGMTAQSPVSLLNSAPSFSPAVNAAVAPSPARKKLSLSDYTKRSKAKDKDTQPSADRESSPASVASGPIVPPLLPTLSEAARESSSAVEDDVRMEDAMSTSGTRF